MISKVRDICNEKNQYFVCEGAGVKSDKRFTAGILHKLNQPCNSKELEYIKSILGNFSDQFIEFYRNYNGALLFCDSLSDTAGFELAPVAEWEALGEVMRAWYDVLDDEERENDEFDWLNDGITFGQVPHSGNYFVLALSGSNKGKIIYSDHDGLEPTVYANSLFEFLEKIISNPVNEIEHLGCYARYSDGKTNTQWMPIQYLVNRLDNLDMAFKQFISNTVSDDLLRRIKDSVTSSDINVLMRKVELLDDPSAYCKNDLDNKTVTGFFLFIDFISALIINLGDSTIQETNNYSNTKHPFVPWVIKYVNDERFHNEIMSKFSKVFAE